MDDKLIRPKATLDLAASDRSDTDDTEGHSLLQIELARNAASARSKEAAEWARSKKARKEAKDREKRSR